MDLVHFLFYSLAFALSDNICEATGSVDQLYIYFSYVLGEFIKQNFVFVLLMAQVLHFFFFLKTVFRSPAHNDRLALPLRSRF